MDDELNWENYFMKGRNGRSNSALGKGAAVESAAPIKSASFVY